MGALSLQLPIPLMAQESASSATTASEIAFTSDRTGSPAIYVMEADGSNPVNVSHAVGSGVYPAWSPDGTKIAFMAFMNVWVMDADGNNPVQITSYLLFTTIAQQPLWMPAGTIGYLLWSESIPERWSIVGSPVRFPRDWLGSGYLDIGGLSWSPDGKKLAFHSTRDGNYEIYTMGADGNTPLKLIRSSWLSPPPRRSSPQRSTLLLPGRRMGPGSPLGRTAAETGRFAQ
ncbi:MAG: PD40 domain-containing protein [Candidatus Latescibacteria bacterium]|nr:PD40 domain-containing protein [Candidatus Latescibacterota bacterium]